MPPVVAVLVSVVILLVALAIILPHRSAAPLPPPSPPLSPADSPATTQDPDRNGASTRDDRFAEAQSVLRSLNRAQHRAKLILVLGGSAFLALGIAYGALRSALEQDWSGLIALGAVGLFMAWFSRLCWGSLD